MIKLIRDIKLFLAWRDTPYHDFAEIHELCMLAARRCSHDLEHASSEIWYTTGDKKEVSDYFSKKSRMWQDIFYPVENQKRYRHELHAKISRLETCQEKLTEILKKHNVPWEEWEEYSPGGGIPF